MGCEPIAFPGSRSSRSRSRGRRARSRCRCGAVAPYLCDGLVPTRRSGTCDAPICGSCATGQGAEQHLCPDHARPAPARLIRLCEPALAREIVDWIQERISRAPAGEVA